MIQEFSILSNCFLWQPHGTESGKVSLHVSRQRECAIRPDLQGYYTKTQQLRKILDVTIDSKLSFDEHNNICKTANKKLSAFSRVNHCMKQNQTELLLSKFMISRFQLLSPRLDVLLQKIYQKDKCCSLKIFTDFSKFLRVSLFLIITGSTPNKISLMMYEFLMI